MAKGEDPSLIQRYEGLPIIIVFVAAAGAVHVHGAAGVPAAVHLHDLPVDPAAADAARGRPDLRHRRRRDRPLLPGDHLLLRLRLRRPVQGIRPRLDRGDRRPRLGRPRRLHQRHHHRQDRHPLLHRHARHPVLLVRHGDRAVRAASPTRCAAPRRARSGNGSSAGPSPASETAWVRRFPMQALWTADHRHLPVVHPQPPPLRRARPVHRRFQRGLAGGRHRRRPREDQDLHA